MSLNNLTPELRNTVTEELSGTLDYMGFEPADAISGLVATIKLYLDLNPALLKTPILDDISEALDL